MPDRQWRSELEFSGDELASMGAELDRKAKTPSPADALAAPQAPLPPPLPTESDRMVDEAFRGGSVELDALISTELVPSPETAGVGPISADMDPEVTIDPPEPTGTASLGSLEAAVERILVGADASAERPPENDSVPVHIAEDTFVRSGFPLSREMIAAPAQPVGASAQTVLADFTTDSLPGTAPLPLDLTESPAAPVPLLGEEELTSEEIELVSELAFPQAASASAQLSPSLGALDPVVIGEPVSLPAGPPSLPPLPPEPGGTPADAASSATMAAALPASAGAGARPRRRPRVRAWFEEIFDEDYLRTLPYMTARQTEREADFIETTLGVPKGGRLLDIGAGYGRHALELAARGYHIVGVDLSLPLLIRAADEAQRRGLEVSFVHGDMRELSFHEQFDGAYCMLTTFGYFDDETNRRVAQGFARALKHKARLLIEIINRDYVIAGLPTRVWWEGDGCVVLEEVDFNAYSSRIISRRSVVFEDGRQFEQEISIRAYALHELGKLLHQVGFRVVEVAGSVGTRSEFFGPDSRVMLITAEKRST